MPEASSRGTIIVGQWAKGEALPEHASDLTHNSIAEYGNLREILEIPYERSGGASDDGAGLVTEIAGTLKQEGISYRTFGLDDTTQRPTAFIDPFTGAALIWIVHHAIVIAGNAEILADGTERAHGWWEKLTKHTCAEPKSGGAEEEARRRAEEWAKGRLVEIKHEPSELVLQETTVYSDGKWIFKYGADHVTLEIEVVHEGKNRYELCVGKVTLSP